MILVTKNITNYITVCFIYFVDFQIWYTPLFIVYCKTHTGKLLYKTKTIEPGIDSPFFNAPNTVTQSQVEPNNQHIAGELSFDGIDGSKWLKMAMCRMVMMLLGSGASSRLRRMWTVCDCRKKRCRSDGDAMRWERNPDRTYQSQIFTVLLQSQWGNACAHPLLFFASSSQKTKKGMRVIRILKIALQRWWCVLSWSRSSLSICPSPTQRNRMI